MQFRYATLLAAVVLATAAAASSPAVGPDSIAMRSAAGVKAHGHAHIAHSKSARKNINAIENDLELINVLHKNKDASPKIKAAVYADLNAHMQDASADLSAIVKAANKRAASTVDATDDLAKDLNNVLCKVHKFLKELLNNAGADKIEQGLAEPLVKGLKTVVHQLNAGLKQAAPELAKLLDPLLNTLEDGAQALGLNLRDVEEEAVVERAAKSASKKGKEEARLTASINAHLDIVKGDLKKLHKLKKSGNVNTPEGKKLINQVLKNAGDAGKAIKHLLAKAKAEGIKIESLHRRAESASADDLDFETLLYRAVHDLICVLHAVLKLTFDLLGNLGLDAVEDLLKGVDTKALEPLFSGLKEFSKDLGSSLNPLLNPVLNGLNDLLAKLNIDL